MFRSKNYVLVANFGCSVTRMAYVCAFLLIYLQSCLDGIGTNKIIKGKLRQAQNLMSPTYFHAGATAYFDF
jgi:hypothetical protein